MITLNPPHNYLEFFRIKSATFHLLWSIAEGHPTFRPKTSSIRHLLRGSLFCPKVDPQTAWKFSQIASEIEADPFRRNSLQMIFLGQELEMFDTQPKDNPFSYMFVVAQEVDNFYWDYCMAKRLQEYCVDRFLPLQLDPAALRKYSIAEQETLVVLSFLQATKTQEVDEDLAVQLLRLVGR